MLFDNPVFADWYTDTMDIYRIVDEAHGNVDKKERKLFAESIACRIYQKQRNGPDMKETAAASGSVDRLSCDLGVDVRAGDELHVVRGGLIGMRGRTERYIADSPHPYYDPVGGSLSGLEHQEITLLADEVID